MLLFLLAITALSVRRRRYVQRYRWLGWLIAEYIFCTFVFFVSAAGVIGIDSSRITALLVISTLLSPIVFISLLVERRFIGKSKDKG